VISARPIFLHRFPADFALKNVDNNSFISRQNVFKGNIFGYSLKILYFCHLNCRQYFAASLGSDIEFSFFTTQNRKTLTPRPTAGDCLQL